MTLLVDAVYEQGVLRPEEPIPLAEGTRVEVIIIPRRPAAVESPAEILKNIAALPLESAGEVFTAREHDRILYGEKEGK